MKLVIYKECRDRLPVSRINRLIEMIIKEEGEANWLAGINLILTDDDRLRDLNLKFRRKDITTDILSFNIDSPEDFGGTFGELYISTERVKCQANEFGSSKADEYLRLICHGFLHLCGYDHVNKVDEKVMFSRQEHYLLRLRGEGKC